MPKYPNIANKYNTLDFNELILDIELYVKHPNLAPLLVWHDSQTLSRDISETLRKEQVQVSIIDAEHDVKSYLIDDVRLETPQGPRMTEVPKNLPLYEPTGDQEIDTAMDANLGKGVILINNVFRANDWVKGFCKYLANSRSFNKLILGSGWVVVCLESYYQSSNELPSLLDLIKFRQAHYRD